MTRGLKQDQGFTVQVTVKTRISRWFCSEKITSKKWEDEQQHGDVKCNTHCNLRTSTRTGSSGVPVPWLLSAHIHTSVCYSSPCPPLQEVAPSCLTTSHNSAQETQLCLSHCVLQLHCSHAAAPSLLLLWHPKIIDFHYFHRIIELRVEKASKIIKSDC